MACAVLFSTLSMTASATDVVLACPDLSTAQQLGACPSEKDLRALYTATCPKLLQKRGECKPFEAFARSKDKALWAAQSQNEEFLSYIQCKQTPEVVKASKAVRVGVKCDMKSGRCEARCGYENGVSFSLRVKGSCQTATRQPIDCTDDPQSCVVKCELFED